MVARRIDHAPEAWATAAARTSDGYLVQIARADDFKLATFDSGIADPAAELIA